LQVVQVSLFHPWGNFEQVAEAANCAEAMGFDGCLFGEHHGTPQNDRPQLLILLAGLAARTKRIRLGTSILLSPLYDPVQVAEAAAMVDVNSGGRLILGVGLGYQPSDFQHFGVPFKQRVSRFEEGIEVIRRAWTTERFSYAGKRYRYEDVGVYPKPLQQPHPPLWMAAWSTEGARRAGRLGDAYVTDPIQDLNATRAFGDAYRAAAADQGRAADVVIMRELLCAPTRSEAIDRYGEGLLGTYRYYWQNNAFNAEHEPLRTAVKDASELTFDLVARERAIYGSPADCLGQLEQWVKTLGASHVQLAIPYPFREMSQERQLAQVRFVGEELMGRLHAL
jgi:probable F420-dependent oxidoreductase